MDFSHDLISDVAITLEIILNKQAYNLFEDQRFKTDGMQLTLSHVEIINYLTSCPRK